MEHALSTPTPLHGYQTLPGTLSRSSYVVLSLVRNGKQVLVWHLTSTIGPHALLSKPELLELVA